IAKYDGEKVGEDDMTVVSVAFQENIFNTDTPQAMLDRKAFRIPPRVATPISVLVTPNLGTSGQKLILQGSGQGSGNGSFTIDGNNTKDLTSTGYVNLSALDGSQQTAPGHAGRLRLVLQVRGENTIQSNGFSVAAIPQNWSTTFVSLITGGDAG